MTAGFRSHNGGNRNHFAEFARQDDPQGGPCAPVGAPQEGSIRFDYINFLSADAFSTGQPGTTKRSNELEFQEFRRVASPAERSVGATLSQRCAASPQKR